MPRESIEQRARRAEKALKMYLALNTIREVAQRMGVSYGTAYALIQEAGGPEVFRPRGTRIRKPEKQ